jgi:hypothetical protein
MSDVPYQLVPRGREGGVQRDGQLDDAQPSADVPARARADVDEARTHLVGERAQLVSRAGAKVGGRVDLIEK